MSYMLLIVEPVDQRQQRSLQRFGASLQAHGLLLASESLAGLNGAARVQVREGRTQVLDGPFAEAKEMVGGFFLLNCASRNEALALAAECPAAAWCTVEVRALAPCYQVST